MNDKFELLLALARERHFGRAAEACGITQPTLSSALKSLEEQLGVRIVERGSRFVGFTAEGERVLEHARRTVADARMLRQELDAMARGLSGSLALGAIPTALPFVPELTIGFARAHAGVRLAVRSMSSDAILTGLDNLELDVGISYIDTEPLARFRTLPLYDERYALLVAAGSALAEAPSISWSEASRLALCLLTPDMQNRRIIDRQLSEAGAGAPARPVVQIESNSMMTLHAHVRSGAWATIAALGQGERFEPPSGLRAIALVEPEITHQIGLVMKRQDPQPPIAAAFLAAVRKRK